MLFPPILNSFQPAFTPIFPYSINFSLSTLMNENEISHIQIKIVYQNNNTSIANDSLYPDGIIYKEKSSIYKSNNIYFVNIEAKDLKKFSWDKNTYYKVQIRFGNNELWGEDLTEFSNWKSESIKNNNFSEWSSIMILKCISKPEVYIQNNNDIEFSLTPIFYGVFNNSSTDYEDLYKFELYNENQLIEDSGWLQHNSYIDNFNQSSIDSYRFKTILENFQSYSVVYYVQTNNFYVGNSESYDFSVQAVSLNELKNITFKAIENSEEASIDCYITTDKELYGNYIISRSCEKTNFNVSEDLFKFSLFNEQLNNKLIFSDKTIENGVKYKYSISQEQVGGLRSLPLYDNEKIIKQVYFPYAYLLSNNIQLKLNFNVNISSFKRNVSVSKTTTIGSKYPIFQKNSETYYAEFPISGLISIQSDLNHNFLSESIDTNLTQENSYIEYLYRQRVEEFLNENKYKLFKSPTEGNFIVYLTNISLQPNTTLNRFLYTFSATASEVMENTIENLQQFNIQNFGSYNTESTFTDTSFGQLNDNYIGIYSKDENGQYTIENDNPTNLINEIEKFVNVSTETSIYKLNKILEFKISINDPTIESLIFILDGQEILIKNGKTYTLINYNPKTLYLKQTAEVLIDFKYEVIITSIAADYLNFNFQTYSPWGQIEGLYDNISLLDLIKEQSKIETEKNKLDSESLNIYKEDLNLYINDNNTKAYSFISLLYFDIDALEGTKIQLVGFDNKIQDIIIGPTERYTLNLKENIIKDIKLIDSANILINYKTLVLYSNNREEGG